MNWLALFITIFIGFSCTKGNINRDALQYAQVDYDDILVTFGPLPQHLLDPKIGENAQKIALGKKLYYEKQISVDGDISCNTCHKLDKFGVDQEKTSLGHNEQRGQRNTPSVYNSGLSIAQSWDGGAKNLAEQAKLSILDQTKMAMPDEFEVLSRLKVMDGYQEMFEKAFPRKSRAMTLQTLAESIAAFEMNLLTPGRFDEYLRGKKNALTFDELEGLRVFSQVGCISCHNGPAVGSALYQKIGLEIPYDTEDEGRFKVTNNPEDKYFFKVPSLRNITMTAPYFHDGKIKTLKEAITLMGNHQLGVELKPAEVEAIEIFLGSLKGEIPENSKM